MKQNSISRKRKVSGFTLLEIVIVMGIITILLGVLIPTMRTYMTKSRLNTANSNAKVIFNSLQTIMQEYEFEERSETDSVFYGARKAGNIQLYCVNGNIQLGNCVLKDSTGNDPLKADHNAVTLDADELGATIVNARPGSLGARMRRLYTDYETVTWCALIRDYSVAGVLCATSPSSHYIGGYPLQVTQRNLEVTSGSDSITADSIPAAIGTATVNGSVLDTYCKMAWNNTDMTY